MSKTGRGSIFGTSNPKSRFYIREVYSGPESSSQEFPIWGREFLDSNLKTSHPLNLPHSGIKHGFLARNFSNNFFLFFRWQLPGHPTVRAIIPHHRVGLYGRLGEPSVSAAHLCHGPGGRHTQHLLCKTSQNFGSRNCLIQVANG